MWPRWLIHSVARLAHSRNTWAETEWTLSHHLPYIITYTNLDCYLDRGKLITALITFWVSRSSKD